MSVTFQGSPVGLKGTNLEVGANAPEIVVVGKDLSEIKVGGTSGKIQIITTFPSIDTGVCQNQTRAFNKEFASGDKFEVITISKDLPFALGRFCGAEGIDGIKVASDFRAGEFGKAYGLELADSVLAGLLARAVVVVKDGKIAYKQIVSEITTEPDYSALRSALAAL